MRSPGVIYRRYRQIKKKILYDKLAEAHKCLHCNCHYGKRVTYTDEFGIERVLKVCNYNSLLDEGRVEGCTDPIQCNAFANKWSKEKVIEEVDKELADYNIKKRKYPELTVLEWALDKDLNDATKNPGVFGTFIIKCIEFLESILKYK
jgi:hypothetical protein